MCDRPADVDVGPLMRRLKLCLSLPMASELALPCSPERTKVLCLAVRTEGIDWVAEVLLFDCQPLAFRFDAHAGFPVAVPSRDWDCMTADS